MDALPSDETGTGQLTIAFTPTISRNLVIKLEGTGRRMSIPQVLLDEAGLSRNGRAVSARWEMTGDGMCWSSSNRGSTTPPNDPATAAEPLVDIYGTARGEILTADDSAFVMQMLGSAGMALDETGASKRPVRSRRKLIPIKG